MPGQRDNMELSFRKESLESKAGRLAREAVQALGNYKSEKGIYFSEILLSNIEKDLYGEILEDLKMTGKVGTIYYPSDGGKSGKLIHYVSNTEQRKRKQELGF